MYGYDMMEWGRRGTNVRRGSGAGRRRSGGSGKKEGGAWRLEAGAGTGGKRRTGDRERTVAESRGAGSRELAGLPRAGRAGAEGVNWLWPLAEPAGEGERLRAEALQRGGVRGLHGGHIRTRAGGGDVRRDGEQGVRDVAGSRRAEAGWGGRRRRVGRKGPLGLPGNDR